MTYAELIDAVAIRRLLTKKTTRHLIEAFVAELRIAVLRQGRFNVPGLGVFRVRSRAARRVRNPDTDMLMELPARRVVTCRVSSTWRVVE